MISLQRTLGAFAAPDFEAVLKEELAAQAEALPLQSGLRHTDRALTDEIQVVLMGAETKGDTLLIRAGVFYQGLQSGCGCADDPTPVEPVPEYCELEIIVDRDTGEGRVRLLEEAPS